YDLKSSRLVSPPNSVLIPTTGSDPLPSGCTVTPGSVFAATQTLASNLLGHLANPPSRDIIGTTTPLLTKIDSVISTRGISINSLKVFLWTCIEGDFRRCQNTISGVEGQLAY